MSKVITLPIEQAIIVPSTRSADKHISQMEMNKRVDDVRKFLSQKFGGYTSIKGMGGWYSDNKKKLIKEDIVKVTGFSSSKDYNKNKNMLAKQIMNWGKQWGQESMGYEKEGDLFLYDTKRKTKLKARIRRRKK
jgi:hypothetical protein